MHHMKTARRPPPPCLLHPRPAGLRVQLDRAEGALVEVQRECHRLQQQCAEEREAHEQVGPH